MLYSDFIASAGLNPLAFPVQIIDLQLNKFHLRMLRQDLIQQLGAAVERESGMFNQPCRLFIQKPAEAVQLLIFRQHGSFNAVDQIVVKIGDAGFLKLFVEDPVPVFQKIDITGVQLGGQGVAVSGMAVHEGGLCRVLALEAAVHPGCVKVGKASLQKPVYHLFDLFHVDVARIGLVVQRQAHKAEAKFFCLHIACAPFLCFSVLPSIVSYGR